MAWGEPGTSDAFKLQPLEMGKNVTYLALPFKELTKEVVSLRDTIVKLSDTIKNTNHILSLNPNDLKNRNPLALRNKQIKSQQDWWAGVKIRREMQGQIETGLVGMPPMSYLDENGNTHTIYPGQTNQSGATAPGQKMNWMTPQWRRAPKDKIETEAEKHAREKENQWALGGALINPLLQQGGSWKDSLISGASMLAGGLGGPWGMVASMAVSVLGSLFNKNKQPFQTKEVYSVRVVNMEDLATEYLKVTQAMRFRQTGSGIDSLHSQISLGSTALGY